MPYKEYQVVITKRCAIDASQGILDNKEVCTTDDLQGIRYNRQALQGILYFVTNASTDLGYLQLCSSRCSTYSHYNLFAFWLLLFFSDPITFEVQ